MQDPIHAACIYTYQDIVVGMTVQHEYAITPAVYEHFLRAFDDRSPIHIDKTYAMAHGFSDKVMHGALLNGFLSHFIGMIFPGRLSLLLSTEVRYAEPSYLEDIICLEMTVAQKLDARNVVVLNAVFKNATRDCIAARARVHVMVKEES